jgi:protein-L-isoaspartate(D-aspartate) O-methyltransferase
MSLRLRPPAAVTSGIGMTSQRARERLVQRLREQGIRDERVLQAMGRLPRHQFLDEALASRAYEDTALPIGLGQTLSQPWVVARMTEALFEHGTPRRVLEVGTGSGYQAAVLAELGLQVFTVERLDELLRTARRRLRQLALDVRSKHADGRLGWPEHGPYDAIVVTAGGALVEPALLDQLADGGTLVAPVGAANAQRLLRLRKAPGGVVEDDLGAVVFVPLLAGVQ